MSDDSRKPDDPDSSETTQPGEIGRITPKQVAKALTPLEREALRKQQEQYYAGEVVTDLDALVERERAEVRAIENTGSHSSCSSQESSSSLASRSSASDSLQASESAANGGRAGSLLFGLLGIALVCGLAILAMIVPQILAKKNGGQGQPQTEKPFSHLHVPEKPKTSVDLSGAIGVLRIDKIPIPLRIVEAKLYQSESIVELLFFKSDSSALPALKLELVFTPGTETADLGNLKEYTLFQTSSEFSFVLEKQFIRRLANHEEVSALSGPLKIGELIRGSMKDSRLDPASGKTISWDLKFEAVLRDAAQSA